MTMSLRFGAEAFGQCKQAVIWVAGLLPDKQQDRTSIADQAFAYITVNGEEGERVRRIVGRFIDYCPRCWGVDRTSRYWNTLLAFVSSEEALALYLERFPREITEGQYAALERYLVQKRGYDAEIVGQVLQRFRIRQNDGCRAPGAGKWLW